MTESQSLWSTTPCTGLHLAQEVLPLERVDRVEFHVHAQKVVTAGELHKYRRVTQQYWRSTNLGIAETKLSRLSEGYMLLLGVGLSNLGIQSPCPADAGVACNELGEKRGGECDEESR